ncbi:PHP domain-containing protein [Geoalkalibacter halelectricus]|uniref:PHP domain-containing protein n=1 Tax=Geoalkalibacter halelectricus TaxID=2847045 RepID=A0ABY5ZTA7_9BACT|nr:PHP domain-containing protein [Geoalkalibacter halelectricus]MDO3379139.1 PHP domain-containing protein [Geoalkalibacter halelectricus]UWZ80899.1 PHP domain-containing protein [Geoalkalibacter halelectricus]
MLFDLHVHTQLSSCSCLRLEEILAQARARGLDGVCITDHDTMAAGRQLREGLQSDGLVVVLGMEYTTSQGDFLLFGPFENLPLNLDAATLLPMVEKWGGVAVSAHPFRRVRPADPTILAGAEGLVLERINGRNSHRENQQAESWLRRYPLTACGGSDAHCLEELGRVVTQFQRPVQARQDLVAALRSGACEGRWNPYFESARLVASF